MQKLTWSPPSFDNEGDIKLNTRACSLKEAGVPLSRQAEEQRPLATAAHRALGGPDAQVKALPVSPLPFPRCRFFS